MEALRAGERRRALATTMQGLSSGVGSEPSGKRDHGDVVPTASTKVTPEGKRHLDHPPGLLPRALSFADAGVVVLILPQ